MGKAKWFFSVVRRDPARLRAGDVRQGHQLRHRLRRRHADHRGARAGGHGRPGARRGRAAGPRRREDPDAAEPGAGRATSSRSPPRSCPRAASTRPPSGSTTAFGQARHAQRRGDRPELRPDRRPLGDLRDHRVAADHLDLHRAALRVEVRRAGADRGDARHPDRGRRLRPRWPGGDNVDGRGAPDDLGLLALRHDHRVRPNQREHPANAERCVLADRQPLAVRGHRPLAGDELLHAAAGARADAVRRRDAAGLRLRAADRHRVRAPTRRSSSPRRCSSTGRSASPASAPASPASLERLGYVPAVRDERAGRSGRRHAQGAQAPQRVRALPGQEVSATEFQEMVRDLGVDADAPAPREPPARGDRRRTPGRWPPRPRAGGGRQRRHRRRARRHLPPTTARTATRARTESPATVVTGGRADGCCSSGSWSAWPSGTSPSSCPTTSTAGSWARSAAALLGSIIFGLIVNLGSIPGENDTDLLTGLEAIPGTLIGLGICGGSACASSRRSPVQRPNMTEARASYAERARQRRFAAHTAQSRSPEPLSDVRRSLSAGPKAPAEREVGAHDPHAAGVVGRRPSRGPRPARQHAGERAHEAPAGAQHARDLGERLARARERADRGRAERRRRRRRRRRAAARRGRRRTRRARRAGSRSGRPTSRRGPARARRSRGRCRGRGRRRPPRRRALPRLAAPGAGTRSKKPAGKSAGAMSSECARFPSSRAPSLRGSCTRA